MKREDVDSRNLWKLDHIFACDSDWEIALSKCRQEVPKISEYAGKLSDRSVLLELFGFMDSVLQSLEFIYTYAMMKRDENVSLPVYQSLCERAESLYVEYMAAAAFVRPELVSQDSEYLVSLTSDPDFAAYDYTIKEVIRNKKHVLSTGEERLLAQAGEVMGVFSDIFNLLDNVDIKFKPVMVDGEEKPLTHGSYTSFLQNPNREVRAQAYENMYTQFKAVINTIATNYGGNVKKDAFYAKVRGYDSSLAQALDGDDIPEAVYKNLLKAVGGNLGVVHQYVEYRKEALGLDTMNMYDMYVALTAGSELKLSFEDAYRLVKEGLAPLGEEYIGLLDRALNDGWIDVYETENKRSGAYCCGVNGVHPYVLLNYHQTTHDIFTVAHEMGHAMHSYYSDTTQPYNKAGYKIFVAEVASTVNEVLLLKHLLSKTKDKKLRKYLLSYYLDMFRTTLFRQTMFSEFEHEAHKMYESGTPLNQENLSNMYLELNRKYYGKGVLHDDGFIKYEWARIPHFYNSFYVYKYATGLTSAVNIANSILKDGDKAVARYKQFLSAGGSKSAYEILKDAGVDLATDTPFLLAMQEFGDTLEALINEK